MIREDLGLAVDYLVTVRTNVMPGQGGASRPQTTL